MFVIGLLSWVLGTMTTHRNSSTGTTLPIEKEYRLSTATVESRIGAADFVTLDTSFVTAITSVSTEARPMPTKLSICASTALNRTAYSCAMCLKITSNGDGFWPAQWLHSENEWP